MQFHGFLLVCLGILPAEQLRFFKICIICENVGVFRMTVLVREGYHRTGIWRNFRRFFKHSDCSRRTVWALCASLRQEQSISGAEKARKSTCLCGGSPPGRVPVMWKDSGNKEPKTVPFESVTLTRKVVPIQLYNRNFDIWRNDSWIYMVSVLFCI